MRRSFGRNLESLDGIFSFAGEFGSEAGMDDSDSYFLNLTLEELFTSLVRLSPAGSDIEIEILLDSGLLTIHLTDRTIEAFDGTLFDDVDTGTPLMQRQPGVLGIQLVKKMADVLEYEFEEGTLVVTARKRLEDEC